MAKETNIRHKAFARFDVTPANGGPGAVTVANDPVTGRDASNGIFITDPADAAAPVYLGIGDYQLSVRPDEGGGPFEMLRIQAYGGIAVIPTFTPISLTQIRIQFEDDGGIAVDPPAFSLVDESYEPMS